MSRADYPVFPDDICRVMLRFIVRVVGVNKLAPRAYSFASTAGHRKQNHDYGKTKAIGKASIQIRGTPLCYPGDSAEAGF
jgi:hypothetical protein